MSRTGKLVVTLQDQVELLTVAIRSLERHLPSPLVSVKDAAERLGVSVEASSADEALSAARSDRVDVVLCDVLLGEHTNGVDVRSRFAREGLGHVPLRIHDGLDARSGKTRK